MRKQVCFWLSAYNHSYGTQCTHMAIKYSVVLTSYSNYQYELIWSKAILYSHSWCATFAFLHQKRWCWSVMSWASEYELRPVYEQNYCLQLAALPAESFSPAFPFQHLIHCAPWQFLRFQKLSAFTITSASLYWVIVCSRVSSAVLSCISTPMDCYTSVFWILMKFFQLPSTVQLWLWCLVACCISAPLLFQA